MSETLGKVEKPLVEDYLKGRKLYFVPLLYQGRESPAEYLEKCNRFWSQVEDKISALELKLGQVNRVYHELVPEGGEEGVRAVRELNEKSYEVVRNRLDKGAELTALEDNELLTEFMDWNRCLNMGLMSQKAFTTVYGFYTEAGKKRNEYITRRLDETLAADEIGVLFMREGHGLHFPEDIQVFYIAPPALDEIRRYLRDQEMKSQAAEPPEAAESPPDNPETAVGNEGKKDSA